MVGWDSIFNDQDTSRTYHYLDLEPVSLLKLSGQVMPWCSHSPTQAFAVSETIRPNIIENTRPSPPLPPSGMYN